MQAEMLNRLRLLLVEAAQAIADPDTGIRDGRKSALLTLRLLEAGLDIDRCIANLDGQP